MNRELIPKETNHKTSHRNSEKRKKMTFDIIKSNDIFKGLDWVKILH